MNLKELGWNTFFEKSFEEYKDQFTPARVTRELKQHYQVFCEDGEFTAKISGGIRHKATNKGMFPAVGDWVVIKLRKDEGTARIQHILPRQTKFSRKVILSATDEQVIATNITTVFIVTSLEGEKDFNLRRIERYLALAQESGASAVILLNKVDLCDKVEQLIEEVKTISGSVPIHAISATEQIGTDELHTYLGEGQTVTFLGSSGVGKSALINTLMETEVSPTGEVRKFDGTGRHTTTHRELFWLPDGGAMIDTPGMRELQMWTNERSLNESFGDILDLGQRCRFNDCTHLAEPGCMIQSALEDGELNTARYENYLKLKDEFDSLKKKQEEIAKTQEKINNPKRQSWSRKSNKKNRKY